MRRRDRRAGAKVEPSGAVAPATPLTISRLWLVLSLLVILMVVAVRIRLLNVPLERDEGEYAYTGQLMLQGVPPYRLAANMKLPGTHVAYALIMAVFGQTTAGIHVGFLLVNLGAVMLVFLLGRRLLDLNGGLAAAASYALLSLGAGVYGTSAHATQFVVLPALGGTLLLLQWTESRRSLHLFASGLLYGIAFLMKQPGILFAVFGGLYLIWMGRKELATGAGRLAARLGIFAAAAALPFGVTCLILWRAGVFANFWFWTVSYGRQYGTMASFADGTRSFLRVFPTVLEPDWGIWILAAGGLGMAWWKKERRDFARFASALLLCSCVAASIGLYFRGHYFVLLLPAVALLVGACVAGLGGVAGRTLPLLLFAGAVLWSVAGQQDFMFELNPIQVSRRLYWPNPFPEAVQIADYLQPHSNPNARVAVLGSEPEIYFYSRRHSASSFLYTYGLMEPQPYALEMQEQMIRDIEAVRPEFVITVGNAESWLKQPASSTRLIDWWSVYGQEHYLLEGVVDMIAPDRVECRWGAAAASYSPRSSDLLLVVRRKP